MSRIPLALAAIAALSLPSAAPRLVAQTPDPLPGVRKSLDQLRAEMLRRC